MERSRQQRLIAIDSNSRYVIAHYDADAEFIPLSQVAVAVEIAPRENLVTVSAGLFLGIVA